MVQVDTACAAHSVDSKVPEKAWHFLGMLQPVSLECGIPAGMEVERGQESLA